MVELLIGLSFFLAAFFAIGAGAAAILRSMRKHGDD